MPKSIEEQPVSLPADVVEIVQIPVGELVPSPFNKRIINPNDPALVELANSIREDGVIVPILVREVEVEGDVVDYEIVAGHRRWEASKLAGLETIPAQIREMSDDWARQVQVVENLQREELGPIEEAEAFAQLMQDGLTVQTVAAKLGKEASYIGRRVKLLDAVPAVREALTAGAIEVGHALELVRLSEEQQIRTLSELNCGFVFKTKDEEDFEEGSAVRFPGGDGEEVETQGVCRVCGCTEEDACEISTEVESESIPCSWANEQQTLCSNPDCIAADQKKQAEAGSEPKSSWFPTRSSVAQLRQMIARAELKSLDTAPFPLFVKGMTSYLRGVSCEECPSRSGNAALLFDDCGKYTCTNRPCYDEKVAKWVDDQIETAKGRGSEMVRITEGWTADRSVISHHYFREVKGDRCASAKDAIWIDGANAGHRIVICNSNSCLVHWPGIARFRAEGKSEKQIAEEKAKRKVVLAKVKAEKQYRSDLFKAIAAGPEMSTEAWIKIAVDLFLYVCGRADSLRYQALEEATGISVEAWKNASWRKTETMRDELKKFTISKAGLVALLAISTSELTVGEHEVTGKRQKTKLEALAELLGVTVERPAIDKPATKKASAKKAAAKKVPVKKAAAKGGK